MRRSLALPCLLALVLAAWGGAPWFHPDTLVPRALAALRHGGNSGFYDYPALVTDCDAVAYAVAFAVGRLAGGVHSFGEFESFALAADPAPGAPWASGQFPAQVVTILFSLLGVACAAALAMRLGGSRATGMFAGSLTATSILWVANAHQPTVDIPLAALSAAAILGSVHVFSDGPPDRRGILLLGSLLGLVSAAKYNGAIASLSIVLPMGLIERARPGRFVRKLLGLCATALAVFLLANPYDVSHFHRFATTLWSEIGWIRPTTGHLGFQTAGPSWGFHIATTLVTGYGILPCGLALIGLGSMIADPRAGRPVKIALLAFPVAYFLLMGISSLAFQRYMLPLIPFLAVGSALGARAALAAFGRVTRRRWATVLVAGLIVLATLGPALVRAVHHDRLLLERDTRSVALFALARVYGDGRGLSVCAPSYTRQMLHRSRVLEAARMTEDCPADLARVPVDLLLFDSFEHDRYLYDPRGAALLRATAGSEGYRVVQVSPFTAARDSVPFSPESGATPYPPDLIWRRSPGPFIEIYARDAGRARALATACRAVGIEALEMAAANAYYLPRFNRIASKRGPASDLERPTDRIEPAAVLEVRRELRPERAQVAPVRGALDQPPHLARVARRQRPRHARRGALQHPSAFFEPRAHPTREHRVLEREPPQLSRAHDDHVALAGHGLDGRRAVDERRQDAAPGARRAPHRDRAVGRREDEHAARDHLRAVLDRRVAQIEPRDLAAIALAAHQSCRVSSLEREGFVRARRREHAPSAVRERRREGRGGAQHVHDDGRGAGGERALPRRDLNRHPHDQALPENADRGVAGCPPPKADAGAFLDAEHPAEPPRSTLPSHLALIAPRKSLA